MSHPSLAGRNILVVEDDFFIATHIQTLIVDVGGSVVGPVGTLSAALHLASTTERLDAAVLDINLRGEMVFPVAKVLAERGIVFVFATGYDRIVVPDEFADVVRCGKPPSQTELLDALGA